MEAILVGDRIAANETVTSVSHGTQRRGVIDIGSLVRIRQAGHPQTDNLHLVTALLLTSDGVKYGLDGGRASYPDVNLELRALPTQLLIKMALRLAAQSAPELRHVRPLTRPVEA